MPARSFPTQSYRSSVSSEVCNRTFPRIVHDGQSSGAAVMKGFSGDPNVAPYVDDIYAYLQARAYGELGRGRPIGFGE
jgi:hypothetical protein